MKKRNKNFLKPELVHSLLVEKALLSKQKKALLGKWSATTAIYYRKIKGVKLQYFFVLEICVIKSSKTWSSTTSLFLLLKIESALFFLRKFLCTGWSKKI